MSQERLQKIVARAGVASRRAAEEPSSRGGCAERIGRDDARDQGRSARRQGGGGRGSCPLVAESAVYSC